MASRRGGLEQHQHQPTNQPANGLRHQITKTTPVYKCASVCVCVCVNHDVSKGMGIQQSTVTPFQDIQPHQLANNTQGRSVHRVFVMKSLLLLPATSTTITAAAIAEACLQLKESETERATHS